MDEHDTADPPEPGPAAPDDAAAGAPTAPGTLTAPGPEPRDGTDRADEPEPAVVEAAAPAVDLAAIAADLADVELALARLANGSYWTDEVTGETLPDELLESSPTARRVSGA